MNGDGLRLLPWSSGDGKPCYLSTDDPHSILSLLADDLEEEQLVCGEDVLAGAVAVLADPVAGERAVRFALARAVESLREVLRVAVSRGGRLESAAVVPDHGLDQA
ncbi:hypothetical protein RCO28_20385 [Streptomyces sp. LHD-70]|uniref:hypothetical protein n=1 Tax=Streptomyces sp. LHD-70 TaxID=3072140 RepID=UPI00280CF308|nr:hypothetical protein [Streptomyces sp. LHD-70]MDQ8704832.1 hypothetical protein [Streptomyces sp. LHD-70]